MTKKERVIAAIEHRVPDRVPKGELHIEGELANLILKKDYPLTYECFEREVEIRNKLHMDLVNVGEWPQWEIGTNEKGNKLVETVYGQVYEAGTGTLNIIKPAVEDIENAYSYKVPDISKVSGDIVERFAKETDFFVFAQVGGPVTQLDEMFSMEDFMVYSLTNTNEMHCIAEKVIDYEISKAKLFIDKGADGIVIGDDIAFNSGIFLPPTIMEQNVFPFWEKMVKEIKRYKNIPIILHSDGNITKALQKIADCGFDGIQSIQPSAGMDIKHVKEMYGDRLCLWGNIDLDYVMCFGKPDEVKKAVKETIKVANCNGGHILSTCNSMIRSIPKENIFAMIEASEEEGIL